MTIFSHFLGFRKLLANFSPFIFSLFPVGGGDFSRLVWNSCGLGGEPPPPHVSRYDGKTPLPGRGWDERRMYTLYIWAHGVSGVYPLDPLNPWRRTPSRPKTLGTKNLIGKNAVEANLYSLLDSRRPTKYILGWIWDAPIIQGHDRSPGGGEVPVWTPD